MKGLLIKEVYQLKNSLKTTWVTLALFVGLGLIMKSIVYVGMMITVLITNMILLSMGYDENSSWKRYAMTMPICRRDLITVKYLLLYGLTIFSVLFTALVGILIGLLADISLGESLATTVGCAMIALLSTSINIMLCTKFGVEKARFMTLFSYMVPFAILGFVYGLMDGGHLQLENISNAAWAGISTVASVMIIVMSILCWHISCRIIEGQDL